MAYEDTRTHTPKNMSMQQNSAQSFCLSTLLIPVGCEAAQIMLLLKPTTTLSKSKSVALAVASKRETQSIFTKRLWTFSIVLTIILTLSGKTSATSAADAISIALGFEGRGNPSANSPNIAKEASPETRIWPCPTCNCLRHSPYSPTTPCVSSAAESGKMYSEL